MNSYIPGQRVISDAELQMGLGTVLSTELRTVTVLFLSTDETRTYAIQTAPLTRVEFAVGDSITSHDGVTIKITEVRQHDGLLTYVGLDKAGKQITIEEGQLDNAMQLNRPSERLFNGQVDADKWFALRYRTQSQLNRLAHSDLYGLTGVRTSLIPHQLYIAHEVANRYAPRVLLADEVGLGKTIEAGLILHHQLQTERAHRVLIVVPETLMHQWLVEMLRRFNLHFKIFDEARFADVGDDEDFTDEADDIVNAFMSEQLVLCSLDFLAADPARYQQCLAAEWDLMVVDEAHHLQWSQHEPGHEYQLIEKLAHTISGVLLLTATPEQLGKESHFARLRLLDPDRFHDFDAFVEEEQSYEPVAQVVEDLLNGKALDEADIELIESTLDEGDNKRLLDAVVTEGAESAGSSSQVDSRLRGDDENVGAMGVGGEGTAAASAESASKPSSRLTLSRRGNDSSASLPGAGDEEKKSENDSTPSFPRRRESMVDEPAISQARIDLVEHLLDRHGTGRVLFRNTRAAIKGFPDRVVHSYPLDMPAGYQELFAIAKQVNPELLLVPECLHEAMASELSDDTRWSHFDPRIEWLNNKLAELAPQKVLVIAASAETALDIAYVLKTKTGIHAAVFHEGLSIVERDKAAAYFADKETGSQVLVCSEIGSEGRNFQFAHHLVLFDLPLNPDLLEQRIGRLDRIGQTETIQIHVPYLKASAQEVMFNWYHQSLNAFEQTCPAGHPVFVQVQDELNKALADASHSDELLAHSKQLHTEMTEAMHRGRDRLLEYNSCRQHIAQSLKQRALDEDAASDIADYMDGVFDCFGVDTELHSENCFILRPTDHMTQAFPGLHDEGMTITYSRDTALTFEDAHYLSWEHPLVRDAMDMVMMNESGNTAVTAIKSKAVPAGSVLLECIYVVEAAPIEKLQTWRYLPPTVVRVLLDERGKDYAARLPHENINKACIHVDNKTATQVVRAKLKIMKAMHKRAEKLAEAQVAAILKTAHAQSDHTLQREIDRLQALKKVNPNVRDDEIRFFEDQLASLNTIIDSASLRLDAIRAIVVT